MELRAERRARHAELKSGPPGKDTDLKMLNAASWPGLVDEDVLIPGALDRGGILGRRGGQTGGQRLTRGLGAVEGLG